MSSKIHIYGTYFSSNLATTKFNELCFPCILYIFLHLYFGRHNLIKIFIYASFYH